MAAGGRALGTLGSDCAHWTTLPPLQSLPLLDVVTIATQAALCASSESWLLQHRCQCPTTTTQPSVVDLVDWGGGRGAKVPGDTGSPLPPPNTGKEHKAAGAVTSSRGGGSRRDPLGRAAGPWSTPVRLRLPLLLRATRCPRKRCGEKRVGTCRARSPEGRPGIDRPGSPTAWPWGGCPTRGSERRTPSQHVTSQPCPAGRDQQAQPAPTRSPLGSRTCFPLLRCPRPTPPEGRPTVLGQHPFLQAARRGP